MPRSRFPAFTPMAALILAAFSLAACQVTDSLFGAEEDTEAETQAPAAAPQAPPPTAVYQPPVYQQPVYQQPAYQQPAPAYQQPAYQQPAYQQTEPYGTAPAYPPSVPAADPGLVARGEYLVSIGNCTDCHTDGALLGDPTANRYLAGSHVGVNVEGLGVMYAPNITPDRQTGIGNWSVGDIMRALREGRRPNGSAIRPPMPIANISQLTEEDAAAIAVYLKSIRPINHMTN
ncbi:MAG: c-type cytochrome, partial [Alphaproteobacteria bacterium]|nr:c-type cytochrome [Alphaproteobacteria bacterium]